MQDDFIADALAQERLHHAVFATTVEEAMQGACAPGLARAQHVFRLLRLSSCLTALGLGEARA